MPRKYTNTEYFQKFIDNNHTPVGQTQNTHTQTLVQCNACKRLAYRRLHDLERSVRMGKGGCRFCADNNNPVNKMNKDWAEFRFHQRSRELGFTPLDPYVTALDSVNTLCHECGLITPSKPATINYGWTHCKPCADARNTGLWNRTNIKRTPGLPGYIYIVEKLQLDTNEMLCKVGISIHDNKRVRRHNAKIVENVKVDNIAMAWSLEQKILEDRPNHLVFKDYKNNPFNSGHAECWYKSPDFAPKLSEYIIMYNDLSNDDFERIGV